MAFGQGASYWSHNNELSNSLIQEVQTDDDTTGENHGSAQKSSNYNASRESGRLYQQNNGMRPMYNKSKESKGSNVVIRMPELLKQAMFNDSLANISNEDQKTQNSQSELQHNQQSSQSLQTNSQSSQLPFNPNGTIMTSQFY